MEHQIKECDSLIELLEELDRDGIQGFRRQEAYKRFLNLQARMRGTPYSGGFELTPLCNFDCKMCYVHLSKSQMEREAKLLTTDQWLDIMRQAVDAGMMHADLTGGECLSYPGFKELYLYLRSRGVEVSVLTNGQLIDDEMADFFAKYPPSVVQITIYGSNNDAYEHVTGRRAFDDVMAAVERLKQRKIRLLLTCTPSQYMQEDTHALLELLRSLNVRYGVGTGSLSARPDTERKLEEYAPETSLYVKLHLDEKAYTEMLYADVPKTEVPMVDYVPKGFKQINRLPCSAGKAAFHVNWKGEMTPCIPFYTVAKSVFEEGFDAAWLWIKNTMATYEPPKECMDCPHAAVCVACPGERTHGVLNGPLNKGVCERYKCYVESGVVRLPEEHKE